MARPSPNVLLRYKIKNLKMNTSNKKYRVMKNNNTFTDHQKHMGPAVSPPCKTEIKPRSEKAEKIQAFLMITQYSQWGLTTNL